MALILASLYALLALQDATPSQGSAQGPREGFIVCPGDRRCPRSNQAGPGASPSYGTFSLRSGFTPDPYTLKLTAGGPLRASSLSSDCSGYVSARPDIQISYSAGSYPLTISASSASPVTLVVNAPDGSWHCSVAQGNGAAVQFTRPASGRYEVWVGTTVAGATAPAEIRVSETPLAPPATPNR